MVNSVKITLFIIIAPSKFAFGKILRWQKSPSTPVQATQVKSVILINYLLPERLW